MFPFPLVVSVVPDSSLHVPDPEGQGAMLPLPFRPLVVQISPLQAVLSLPTHSSVTPLVLLASKSLLFVLSSPVSILAWDKSGDWHPYCL